MTALAPPPGLLTLQEAADRLRVHPETLRVWAREGRVTCCRIGRRLCFRESWLEHYVEAQTRQAMGSWQLHQRGRR